jgi:hypothetical protein
MSDAINIFVSQHAIVQFQERIAKLSEAKARKFILDGIRQATNVRLLPDGGTLRIRTRRPFPFEFRAFVVFDAQKDCFVVKTIVRGNSCVTRKRNRRETDSKE